MLNIFWRRFRRAGAVSLLFEEVHRAHDPLAHPALKAMTARELADIPFPRPLRLRQR